MKGFNEIFRKHIVYGDIISVGICQTYGDDKTPEYLVAQRKRAWEYGYAPISTKEQVLRGFQGEDLVKTFEYLLPSSYI